MKLNLGTLAIVAAGVAAFMILRPRTPAAAPRVAAGGTVWDDQATARFREQLARELASDPGWWL